MMAVYNSHPTDIMAQIGPGIHLDSFEVGDEVYEAFEKEGFNMELISKRYPINDSKSFTVHHSPLPSKWHIDLPACNRQQLISSGVPASQITVSDDCTFQQYKTYFSARRLGINSGRVFTGILLR
jgi:copper oxidase (laccase) domain-containing protein